MDGPFLSFLSELLTTIPLFSAQGTVYVPEYHWPRYIVSPGDTSRSQKGIMGSKRVSDHFL